MNLINQLFGRYTSHPEAIVISCFYNPMHSKYRVTAFNEFYKSIKHLDHRITECVIGDGVPYLPENKNIVRVQTGNLLWHKEALLNKLISELPKKYKYIFWVDADVLFSNKDWLLHGVREMQSGAKIIQPFRYCVHLDKDELEPSFDMKGFINSMNYSASFYPTQFRKNVWSSYCANDGHNLSKNTNYDKHGHVGFAWGAQREVLEQVPLYDKALIGGADHIIAHAASGHIPHPCIDKSFTEDLDAVYSWSRKFYAVVKGRTGYVPGNLYHLWHGDIEKRDYFNRIRQFTKTAKNITQKDENGLYTHLQDETYIRRYFKNREVSSAQVRQDDDFLQSMLWGYSTDSSLMGTIFGGNPIGAWIGSSLRDRGSEQTPNHRWDDNDSTNTPVVPQPEIVPAPVAPQDGYETNDSFGGETPTTTESFGGETTSPNFS